MFYSPIGSDKIWWDLSLFKVCYKWLNMLLWENEALLSNLGFLAGGCLFVVFLTLASAGAGIDWNKE